MPILLTFMVLAACALSYRIWQKQKLRQRLLKASLSDSERNIVVEQVPLIRRLPPELTAKLEGKIRLFLHQVDISGCNGLEVTDGIRLSIAAQACLLIVNSDDWYKNLRTILVYPSAFKSITTTHDGFVVQQKEVIRYGESWSRGPVILSWEHSQRGAENEYDGHNVVLHEFAHQLDDLSGNTNGVPLLKKNQSFAQWERVFLTSYERHLQNVEQGRKTLLDAYGAENHQEFFAVAVEVFFEKPAQLQKDEPEFYAQIAELLKLNPAQWS
ncbi:zinc-dependent peptidase [Yoonia maritima]|uniref:M90 family metallopeptidase n=1 Tax=Yoonia maritima TaxID=1435347 RepID=UPI000D10E304|nr:M90 family metallopeptidase [Yoonia maritima]